jgi:opacity protein-like surface antigen
MKFTVLICALVVCALAPSLHAQASGWEVYAGGGYLRANAGSINVDDENIALTQNSYGWEASVAQNKLGGWIGGVADFSGFYANREVEGVNYHGGVYTYLFGPQFSFRRDSPLSIFVQPLVGVVNARENPAGQPIFYNSTKWAFSVGGGADYKLSQHLALRGRADYLETHFPEAPVTEKNLQNNFRVTAGLVFTFGKL